MATEKHDPKNIHDLEEIKEPEQNPEDGVDIDDAQIEEPKDDAFRKAPQAEQPAKKRRKKA